MASSLTVLVVTNLAAHVLLQIVHRDLAARNILVSSSAGNRTIVKISDFGLARQLQDCNIYHSSSKVISKMRLFCFLHIVGSP